ncbi:MAG: hypothetical protein IJH32_01935 [Ruminococcus sp.]|nr:hypothetical protein [Ruminococcus sp.]
MKKKVFYTELSYVFGIIALAIGVALMERADFGMSMVVAPAYLLHLKISQYLPFFSFGMAEYTLQAVLIIALMLIVRKFRFSYLFSFVTAVWYGFALDGCIYLVSFIPDGGIVSRVAFFIGGMLFCSCGVSLVFHTYISPEAYELFVKEISLKFSLNITKVKWIYDITSTLVAVAMSFIFFGLWHFEGVKLGTVICALVNGLIIGAFSKLFEKTFVFKDGLKLRPLFEK